MAQIDIARHYDGEILESGTAKWRAFDDGEEYFEFAAPVYQLQFNDPYDNDRWLVKSVLVHEKGINVELWVLPEYQVGDWRSDSYHPLYPRMEDVTLTPMWPMDGEARVWNQ